jgi:hypothetical protein
MNEGLGLKICGQSVTDDRSNGELTETGPYDMSEVRLIFYQPLLGITEAGNLSPSHPYLQPTPQREIIDMKVQTEAYGPRRTSWRSSLNHNVILC